MIAPHVQHNHTLRGPFPRREYLAVDGEYLPGGACEVIGIDLPEFAPRLLRAADVGLVAVVPVLVEEIVQVGDAVVAADELAARVVKIDVNGLHRRVGVVGAVQQVHDGVDLVVGIGRNPILAFADHVF